jgi:short-subunit dehydrogenase
MLTTALITGASAGIGATYADRLARRGHNLVLVARDGARLTELAGRLTAEYGVAADTLPADLTDPASLRSVEARLREDTSIGLLINNAGMAAPGIFAGADLDMLERMIQLNVTATMRLSGAIVPRLLEQGGGSIVNVGSILGLAPELLAGVYPATKSFVLTFSQALHLELGPRGIYVQAVLPTATRTEIWERSGMNHIDTSRMMDVGDLVDAALVGFDRKETVTIPPLPDVAQWEAFDQARKAMAPGFRQNKPAERYRV